MFNFGHLLNPIKVRELARSWINEDVPSFDIQGFVVGTSPVRANIFCKEPGVLAGVPFVDAICAELGLEPIQWMIDEGTYLADASQENKIVVGTVCGAANRVLMAERNLLNVLCRCSGVASRCHQVRSKLTEWRGELVGTRKTTPGFRLVEKYGCLVANTGTHRYDLSSMVMLKDNHVKLSCQNGTMAEMIARAKRYAGFHCKVEVECQNLEEAMAAAAAGADVVMLDNFDSHRAVTSSVEIKKTFPSVLVESSGGITQANLAEYAVDSIDVISMSSLMQGYSSIDFSMKIDLQ